MDQKTTTEAQQAGPSAATCRAHGVDLGTICNAHDMARLGQFVSRWGKYKYQNAIWIVHIILHYLYYIYIFDIFFFKVQKLFFFSFRNTLCRIRLFRW